MGKDTRRWAACAWTRSWSTSKSDSAFNGDEVILIGEAENGERVTVEDLAEWADTIPYEILTNINTRVPRIYITE